MDVRQFGYLIKKSVSAWVDDYAPSMGAAIAYYTLFSIAPLLTSRARRSRRLGAGWCRSSSRATS